MRRSSLALSFLIGLSALAPAAASAQPEEDVIDLGDDPAMSHVDRSSVTDDAGEIERWPVDGEAWADEVGTYKAVVISKCAKR